MRQLPNTKQEYLNNIKHDKLSTSGVPYNYDLITNTYLGSSDKFTYSCSDHGLVVASGSWHSRNKCKGCNLDVKRASGVTRARTKKEWLESIQHDKLSFSGKPYTYNLIKTAHVQSTDRITYNCPDHGLQTVYAFSHLTCKCNHCASLHNGLARQGKPTSLLMSVDEAVAKAKILQPDLDYSKVKTYTTKKGTTVWDLGCPKHGWYKHDPYKLLYYPTRGCLYCKKEIKAVTSQGLSVSKRTEFNKSVARLNYEVVDYTRAFNPATLNCKEHGNFIVAKAYYLSEGSICPTCRLGGSLPEILIKNKLDMCDVGNVELHRRDLLDGQELDVYLPKHKLAIEVNGIYWHKDKPKKYHLDKTELAEVSGISILHFTDTDILTNFKLVVSMIHAKCGIFKHRCYAKQTQVIEINWHKAQKFLLNNHIQGAASGSNYLGLYTEAFGKYRLVAVAVFGKPRFNKKYDWELIRFATLRTCQIVGGLSKLIAYFSKTHQGVLISYADRFYSSGNAYKASGFTYVKKTTPSYVWANKEITYSRYQTQKKNLEELIDDYDENLTEVENMTANKFFQIHNCGNLIYEKLL